jgi:hypothetical protein
LIFRTVTIYKATQRGKGRQLAERGFHPSDFPCSPPNADGRCYFAAPGSRGLAEEYNRYYKDGILEVTIDRETYDQYFQRVEKPYQGGDLYELPVPHDLFELLNQYPRVLKPR